MTVLIFIIIFILGELLSGLMCMGIGNFICWAFNIAFSFNYWQGLAIAIILTILGNTFTRVMKKE